MIYKVKIGEYIQESDKVFVSDPSYEYIKREHEPGSFLMKLNLVINNVLDGKWDVNLMIKDYEKERNAELVCIHKNVSYDSNNILKLNWIKKGTIGVDSGQAGIYDLKYYRDDNVVYKISDTDAISDNNIDYNSQSDYNVSSDYRHNSESQSATELQSEVRTETQTETDNNIGEEWYSMNSKLTLKPTDYAGAIPFGAVSSSGYGDGTYNVYVIKNNNSDIVGIKIIFIDEEKKKKFDRIKKYLLSLS